jgi:2-oxoisovalerate dehydrogenase E1 component
MFFDRKKLSDAELINCYERLLFPRLVEERMLLMLRQGKLDKWFSGIGQEAISVGATLAMDSREWILPLHRNLGVFTTRDMSLKELFLQWQGFRDGISHGRERSFHFGSREHHICGMISHLGPQLSVADGIALAHKLRAENLATLVFTGEAGTSEGEFHEALNVASVWDLPVIFLIENNGYGLSTPVQEQYRCSRLCDRAEAYGLEGIRIDGNNVLEVFHTVQEARQYVIDRQRPLIIECMTFRMRGHEEASGTAYVPDALLERWRQKDPLKCFTAYLLAEQVLQPADIDRIREDQSGQISQALSAAGALKVKAPVRSEDELRDVFAAPPAWIAADPDTEHVHMRFVDAISDGLRQAMRADDDLVIMGQDVAEYGGAFKVTEGFVEEFSKARVRNTPLCESAVLGAALGLSLEGIPSIVEMQFADFVSCGFNQIANNLAKIHYRWGQQARVVVRMPTGAGAGAGPFHSQSNESWFFHIPGLKIVYPATPYDAKGLLLAAIEDPNPVLFFEHKLLYRSISGPVPSSAYTVEIGKAHVVQAGDEIAVITYGMGVHWALACQQRHPEVSMYILDLRTLAPLDYDAIAAALRATGKVLVLHEDTLTGGIGAEIAAWLAAHCFEWLDAPVIRCASLDTPVPHSRELEKNFLADSRLDVALAQLINY